MFCWAHVFTALNINSHTKRWMNFKPNTLTFQRTVTLLSDVIEIVWFKIQCHMYIVSNYCNVLLIWHPETVDNNIRCHKFAINNNTGRTWRNNWIGIRTFKQWASWYACDFISENGSCGWCTALTEWGVTKWALPS